MSSCPERSAAALLLACACAAASAQPYAGIGRTATPGEVAAWDIDVRPDFKGLPPGRGNVARGQALWEAQCAGCHGVFGESNEVFMPLVGGTSADDIVRGRVARLADPAYPQRTTTMKLPTLSTLWDYIRRAMPWTAPKTLAPDDVYALVAYLLNLADVVPADFELNAGNVADVQRRLPNRDGMRRDHAMWPGRPAKPDVQGRACMRDCPVEPAVASLLPGHARSAHGDLAQQQRRVGPQRGADTAPPPLAAASPDAPVAALLRSHACTACHEVEAPAVGPSLRDIAKRYAGRADAAAALAQTIRRGGSGNWGSVPMPAQPIAEADATRIARWLADGAKP